jgi:hypothetical protein
MSAPTKAELKRIGARAYAQSQLKSYLPDDHQLARLVDGLIDAFAAMLAASGRGHRSKDRG